MEYGFSGKVCLACGLSPWSGAKAYFDPWAGTNHLGSVVSAVVRVPLAALSPS